MMIPRMIRIFATSLKPLGFTPTTPGGGCEDAGSLYTAGNETCLCDALLASGGYARF